jgi:hypothetical protein
MQRHDTCTARTLNLTMSYSSTFFVKKWIVAPKRFVQHLTLISVKIHTFITYWQRLAIHKGCVNAKTHIMYACMLFRKCMSNVWPVEERHHAPLDDIKY